MCNRIDKVFEEYGSAFSKEEASSEEDKRLIHDFEKSAFEQLSLFLLEGEYVHDIEETEKSIQQFKEVITSSDEYSPSEKGAKELIYLKRRIEDSLVSIQELLAILKNKFSLESSFIYTSSIRDTDVPKGALSLFVELVLPICVQDHILIQVTGYEEIKTLIRLYERVKQEGLGTYQESVKTLLLLKYKFVIYKFLRSKDVPLNYLFNFNTRDDINNFEKSQKCENSLLSDYITFFRVIHLEEKLDVKKKKSIESVDTVAKRAVLVKYYSSIGAEEKELNRLIAEYESEMEGESSPIDFDHYAHNTVLNFLYNCRFSFYVKAVGKQEKLLDKALEFLKPKLNEISTLQQKTGIRNYFPYRKLLEYLVPRIEEELKGIDISECVERALTFADQCLEDFADKLRWCNEHSFLPIQLPFQECLLPIKVANEEHVLFIASGFVRPHDQQKLKQDLEEFRIKLLSLHERYNTLQVVTKAQKTAIELKGKIISLGGSSIAILIFLLTTVNTLNASRKEIALGEMFSLIGGIGVILLLFLSAVYFIALPPKKYFYKDFRFWFFAILSLLCIVLFIYFFCINSKAFVSFQLFLF